MRLLAELVLAARRELGHPETSLDALDIMGIRINDIYDEHANPAPWTQLSERDLYAAEEWDPPWGNRYS